MQRVLAPRMTGRHRVRRVLARALARLAARVAPVSGHAGTALPGLVAERIDPEILPWLAGRFSPVVAVLGANGKTTTTRLAATVLEGTTGRRPASNRSGANLVQGIIAALVVRGGNERSPTPAVLEVDELAFSRIAADLQPRVVVLLNLVRDQLDRYGEIDTIAQRWVRDLRSLPPETSVVVCADDPRLEAIAGSIDRQVWRFGLAASPVGQVAASNDAPLDPPPCPSCGARVEAAAADAVDGWRCPACGTHRAPLDLWVRIEGVDSSGWLVLAFGGPAIRPNADEVAQARVRLTGSAGAYDAAAAVLSAIALGIDGRAAIGALDGATPAFGRLEEMTVADRRVVLTLAKNPVSLAQAATAVEVRRPDGLLIALGDRPADGRDVSWIWDAALDRVLRAAPATLSGDRADDLALRAKYGSDGDGWDGGDRPGGRPLVERALEPALDVALARVEPGGTLMVLATYTPLLGIRGILERRGAASAMPR